MKSTPDESTPGESTPDPSVPRETRHDATPPAPGRHEAIPEDRVAGILARAAELDRDRTETSSVDALRAAALEAGISQSALDVALAEYATSLTPKPETPRRSKPAPKGSTMVGAAPGGIADSRPASTHSPPGDPSGRAEGEKSEKVGVLLSVFLGGFGGHRFYLKDRKGFLYIPFFWTFVPTVVGLVEAFFMKDRVRAFNHRRAIEATAEHPALEPAHDSQGTLAEQTRQPCPLCAELILPQAKICRFCHSNLGTSV